MAMLAEPRRKVKWSIDPQNTGWSSDKSKFGYQMLMKMGWDENKGLGSNENGLKTHVKVSVKNNKFGVGTSKTNSDAWIDQQDDFAALLDKLNKNSNDSSKKTKRTSLEENVKRSRKKIFYSKFIKSKDLSKASNQDLACIFGQRGKSAPATPQDQSEDEGSRSDESTASCPPVVNNEGLVTVKSQYNVHEYFAKRMAELQSKRISTSDNICSVVKEDGKDENKVSKKKKKKNKDSENEEKVQSTEGKGRAVGEENQRTDVQNSDDVSIGICKPDIKKKKKKSKRDKGDASENDEKQIPNFNSIGKQDCESQDNSQCVTNSNNSFDSCLSRDTEIKREKSKKKKRKIADLNQTDDKKDGSKVIVENQEYDKHTGCLNSDISFEYKVKKKKKKLRHMESEAQVKNHESPKREYEDDQLNDKLMNEEPKKKKKKRKQKD